MYQLMCLVTSGALMQSAGAQSAPAEGVLDDKRPVTYEDLAFLKAEGRLRRIKQAVRTDGIRTAGEAKVLSMAIDGVIIFGISLTGGLDPRSPGRRHITEHGLKVLILPPPFPHDPSQRHFVSRWSKWDVRSPAELAVTADFSDTSGWRPPVLSQRMVFILDAGVWKFDRYEP